MTMKPVDISCANASELNPPGGHYSHICVANGVVYVSGQLPIDSKGQPLTGESFERQVGQCLHNVEACLATAGVNKNALLQVRVFLTRVENWSAFNRIYAEWLGEHRPARAVVGVSNLHFGLDIEIEAVALASKGKAV
jgi:reactive intermediate/imine deaminase